MSSLPRGIVEPSALSISWASRCGELDPAALDPDQDQVVRAVAPLDDFGSHPGERARDGAFVEKLGPGGHAEARS